MLSEFNKMKTGKFGLTGKCKVCIAEINKEHYCKNKECIRYKNKEYYENNKEDIANRMKEYRKNNKKSIVEKKKEYYENNKKSILDNHKEWRENNKESILEYKKEYRENNKEAISNNFKQYYEKNKGYIKENSKEYYKKNKEAIAEYKREYCRTPQGREVRRRAINKRRASKLKNGGSYTKKQWEECKEFFNNKCAYSGQPITTDNSHIEHITPLSKGGTSYIWNLCTSLDSVNISKSNNNMETWYRKQEYFSEERLGKIYEWQEYAFKRYCKDYGFEFNVKI